MSATKGFEFEFPAGRYYIGDPCYVLGQKDQSRWDKIVKQLCGKEFNGVVDVDGTKFVAGGTTYGDGTYSDNKKRKYCVDSGTISCIPIKLIEMESFRKDLANIVNFRKPFKAIYVGGLFKFGDVTISTGAL